MQILSQASVTPGGTAATLRLDLFPDVRIVLEHIRVRQRSESTSVVADVTSPQPGRAYMVVSGRSVTGAIYSGRNHYRLIPTLSGDVHVAQIDPSRYDEELPPKPRMTPARPPNEARFLPRAGAAVPLALGVTPPLTPEIDVLVLYTPAVGTALSTTGAATTAQLAVDMANDAYALSGVDQRLRLVHVAATDYRESEDFGTDLDRLQNTNDGFLDEAHVVRDRVAADVVVLLVDSSRSCGKANLAWISSDADDDSAFAVVDYGCVSNHSFAHELGHISGAHHDWRVDFTLLPKYAHGFVSVTGGWYTIMAYPDACTAAGVTCSRTGLFSTPHRTHSDGRTAGDEDSADNVRRLNETALTVAGFRTPGSRVSLYEGTGGTQHHVCVVPLEATAAVEFTGSSDRYFCDNDEARSLRLYDVPAGKALRLFDSPDGNPQDDWLEIVTTQRITEKTIPSLETSFTDKDVAVTYHRNDGLAGKVSRLEVSNGGLEPTIDLFEGNNGRQNLVCNLLAGQPVDYMLTNQPGCANDEARSAVLHNLRAGTVLRLFDDSAGSHTDDWTEVLLKRDVALKTIATFERSFADADVRVTYHLNDGLDGKVSRVSLSTGATGSLVELYEGNDGTQNLVCSLPVGQRSAFDFTRGGCDNDEARSLRLYDVTQGSILLLFDDSGGKRSDDWVAIQTKRDLVGATVGSFERSMEDDNLRMVYSRNDGLDGKVSRLEALSSGDLQGFIAFYEGSRGSQNKLCEITAEDQTVRFKSSADCDNDEARSAILTLLRAGTVLQVFDNSDCRSSDDWTSVTAKRDLFRLTIDTFEKSMENLDVRVEYHKKNGLNGKVSCAVVSVP
ncbi:M12 family metallo-peptidase [Luteitalea sp.]